MDNLIDIHNVAPRGQLRQDADGHGIRVNRGALLRYGPYRRSRPDFSTIRLIAASAIGMGLVLGYAPTALAEVKHLLAAVPAMFDHRVPTPGTSVTDDSYVTNDMAPGDITAQHP